LKEAGLLDAERRSFNRWALAPSLIVLFVIAVVPAIYLLAVSLTPFQLVNPGSATDFSAPLRSYRLLPGDPRFAIRAGKAVVLGRPLYYAAGLLHLAMTSLTSSVDFALIAIIIADTWEWLPYTFLMVLAALQTIPEEFSEAALVDGANRFQIFYYVTLPFITPILVISAMFHLIDSVKAFPLIFLLTGGGPGSVTEVTNYYAYLLAFDTNEIGYSSAVTVVMLLLVAAVSLGLVWMGRSREAVA
jgi:multiple sugar transport system permease protein